MFYHHVSTNIIRSDSLVHPAKSGLLLVIVSNKWGKSCSPDSRTWLLKTVTSPNVFDFCSTKTSAFFFPQNIIQKERMSLKRRINSFKTLVEYTNKAKLSQLLHIRFKDSTYRIEIV
jgi:hypothetical protein